MSVVLNTKPYDVRAVVTSKAKVDDGVTDVLGGASNKSCAGGIILRIALSLPQGDVPVIRKVLRVMPK